MKKQPTENDTEVKADPSLSRKKRVALVLYLAVLFIVALAVVTLSLVIQIHKNTEENNTFAEKAQVLQEDNETLRHNIAALQRDNDSLTKKAEDLQAKVTALEEEKTQLQDANEELKTQNENTLLAYDLLADAKTARENGDMDAFRKAIDQLEPLYQCLSEKAQAEYDALIDAEP